MPIYEYRCADCRRRVNIWWRTYSAAETGAAVCPRCGGTELIRLASRVAGLRSGESRLGNMAVLGSRREAAALDHGEKVFKPTELHRRLLVLNPEHDITQVQPCRPSGRQGMTRISRISLTLVCVGPVTTRSPRQLNSV